MGYRDFGPTFAAEDEGLKMRVSTLWHILVEEGLWQGKRGSLEYRSRREPGPRFGEPEQYDGSPHA